MIKHRVAAMTKVCLLDLLGGDFCSFEHRRLIAEDGLLPIRVGDQRFAEIGRVEHREIYDHLKRGHDVGRIADQRPRRL